MTNKPGKASVEPLPQVNPLYVIAVIHTILVPMNWTYRGPGVVLSSHPHFWARCALQRWCGISS